MSNEAITVLPAHDEVHVPEVGVVLAKADGHVRLVGGKKSLL